MPIYTFICEAGHEEEVLCKYSEKSTLTVGCPTCGEPMTHKGPERIQDRDFTKGKYRFKAVMGDGSKRTVANTSGKVRSDS